MTDDKKKLLFENTAAEVGQAQKFIQVRHIRNCYKADPAYGEGVAKALGLTMDEVDNFNWSVNLYKSSLLKKLLERDFQKFFLFLENWFNPCLN